MYIENMEREHPGTELFFAPPKVRRSRSPSRTALMNAAGIAGLLLFALTSSNLLTGTLLARLDEPALESMRALRDSVSPAALAVAQGVDTVLLFGSIAGVGILGTFWTVKKRFRRAAYLAFAVFGEAAVFLSLAFLFDRKRPALPGALSAVPLPGYPSGHVLFVLILSGVLLYIFLPQITSTILQVSAVAAAAVLLSAVVFLRLVLLAHYLTDIIASLGLGSAWIVITIRSVDAMFGRHGDRRTI